MQRNEDCGLPNLCDTTLHGLRGGRPRAFVQSGAWSPSIVVLEYSRASGLQRESEPSSGISEEVGDAPEALSHDLIETMVDLALQRSLLLHDSLLEPESDRLDPIAFQTYLTLLSNPLTFAERKLVLGERHHVLEEVDVLTRPPSL